jgi:hypothetical protein
LLLFALACALALPPAPPARAQPAYTEHEVKAALLEKVSSFLEWPRPVPADRTLELAVLGDEELAKALERLFAQRPFAGRRLALRRVAKVQQLGAADIVVVGRAEAHELPAVLKAAAAREGVLVVGDADGLAEAGAAVNFYRDGAKVRFEVRPSALKQARIKASFKLLQVARIVGET